MNRLGKWWLAVAGGLVVTGIVGAGAVMAQTPVPGTNATGTTFLARVAQKLGIDTATVETAVKSAKTDEIDALVASGDLTQAQADQIKQRIANAPADAPIFGGGFGDHGGGHGRGGIGDPAKLAAFLGITADQLRTENDATGATLAAVAAAHGKSRDELKAFLTTEAKSRVDQEVADGELTQAEATTKLADMTANLDQMIDRTGGPGRGPGGAGGHGGRGGDGPGYYGAPQTPGTTQTPTANNG
jgi:uncharacterized protein YidB (DUF937 family)